MVTTANRTWNDRGGLGINGDFVPQCDLAQPAGQRRVRRRSHRPTFGTAVPGRPVRPGPDHRLQPSADELGVLDQRAARDPAARVARRRLLPPRLGELPRDRQPAARRPQDFTRFNIVAPTDPRLPAAAATRSPASTTSCPAKFGQARNLNTLSDKYGNQIEHWNGVDITVECAAAERPDAAGRHAAPARRWRTTARSSPSCPR